MYDLVPTKELAMELMSCPLTPKSQSLISPLEFTRMFDGFTSVRERWVCLCMLCVRGEGRRGGRHAKRARNVAMF